MSNSIASTSEWIWDSEHSLYYNPKTTQYAKPQPNGEWIYSEISKTKTTTISSITTTDSTTSTIEDGELDEDELNGTPYYEEDVIEEEEPIDAAKLEEERWSKVPLLRLVVTSSNTLPSAQTVALVDPSESLSFGRDRVHTPRIRLKELEVSKSHAVLFWLEGNEEVEGEDSKGYWGIADSGSMHGTYLRSQNGIGKGKRLSESKVASSPHTLNHLDSLVIGSTRFTVHIHSQFACEQCSVLSDSSNLIPLHSKSEPSTTITATDSNVVDYSTKFKAEKEEIRREKMKGLKDKFLQPKTNSTISNPPPITSTATAITSPSATTLSSPAFIDRAAARRLRTGAPNNPTLPSSTPSPFFQVPGSNLNSTRVSTTSASFSSLPTTSTTTSSIVDPFNSTSRGALLLAKVSTSTVSSSPSKALENKLGTLIQAKTISKSSVTGGINEKPGLGSRNLVVIGSEEMQKNLAGGGKRDWREDVREANRKRFKDMQ